MKSDINIKKNVSIGMMIYQIVIWPSGLSWLSNWVVTLSVWILWVDSACLAYWNEWIFAVRMEEFWYPWIDGLERMDTLAGKWKGIFDQTVWAVE